MNLGEILGNFPNGQERRKWLDDKSRGVGETLQYFLGPGVQVDNMATIGDALNPVSDVGRAMQSGKVMTSPDATGRERFNAGVGMATDVASVVAPAVAGKVVGGPATSAVVESLLGFGGDTGRGINRAGREFAADESGAIDLDFLRSKYPDAKIDVSGNPDRGYTLNRVVLPDAARNEGTGTQIMQDIIGGADESGARVSLSPSGDFGGNKARLNKFYKRFGFVDNKGANKDFEVSESMYRNPSERSQLTPAQNEAQTVESGALRLWHGSPHDFDRFSTEKIGTGSSDAIDGRGVYLTDDQAEAVSYKRPDLRSNPFAPPEAQKFSGDGNIYETALNVAESEILPTRSPITELPENVQEMVRKRFRADDEFADQRNLSWYLEKDPTLQDEIAGSGYKGFSADRGGNQNYTAFNDRDLQILSKNGERTPQGEAQTVLDLLKSGNADQVTDDMLAAADDMYLYNNYDLPMDEASRMARAKEMGFDTDTPLYHGTYSNDEFQSLAPSNRGKVGPGVYLSPDVKKSNSFSGAGEPFIVENHNPRVFPAVATNNPADDAARSDAWLAGRDSNRRVLDDAVTPTKKIYEDRGFDGVSVQDERTILDPSNIRSRFARFDPRLKHLSNLSAGVGGVGLLGSILNGQQNEEQNNRTIRDYLNQTKG